MFKALKNGRKKTIRSLSLKNGLIIRITNQIKGIIRINEIGIISRRIRKIK